MANTRHNSTGLPLITDEGKSVDAFYGPWESIIQFNTWWDGTFEDTDIPAGVLIGIVNGTNVDRYCMIVSSNGRSYWKKLDYVGSIIEFGGTVSDVAVQQKTISVSGTRATVFYNETTGTLVISANNTYYSNWTNCYDYGELDGSDVYPYEGKMYIDITTGQLFYSTNEELSPIEGGGGSLSPEQEDAVNSGITSDLVNELKRLKAMNIQYSSTKDEITLTDANGTQTYNLAEGGGSTAYGNPEIRTFSYTASIDNSGGTLEPTIEVRQRKTVGGVDTTITYTSVDELVEAGATVRFSFVSTTTGFSIDANTGDITVSSNPSGQTRTAQVSISISNLNAIGMDCSTESNEIRQGKTFITSISYGEPEDNGDGSYTVTPVYTASNGQTYSYSDYVEADMLKESFSFAVAEGYSLYGATLDAETGAITYNPTTILSSLSAGEAITVSSIDCVQNGIETITVDAPDFFNFVAEEDYQAFTEWIGDVGGNKTDDTVTTLKYRSGHSASLSIPAVEDDVLFFKLDVDLTRDYAVHQWVLETEEPAFVQGDTAYTKNSTFDTSKVENIIHIGNAKHFLIYKVTSSSAQYLTICGARKAMGYYNIQ